MILKLTFYLFVALSILIKYGGLLVLTLIRQQCLKPIKKRMKQQICIIFKFGNQNAILWATNNAPWVVSCDKISDLDLLFLFF